MSRLWRVDARTGEVLRTWDIEDGLGGRRHAGWQGLRVRDINGGDIANLVRLNLETGQREPLTHFETHIALGAPAVSPDGQRVVFAMRGKDGWDLALREARMGAVRWLTQDGQFNYSPQWVDDDQLLFLREHDERLQAHVLTVSTGELHARHGCAAPGDGCAARGRRAGGVPQPRRHELLGRPRSAHAGRGGASAPAGRGLESPLQPPREAPPPPPDSAEPRRRHLRRLRLASRGGLCRAPEHACPTDSSTGSARDRGSATRPPPRSRRLRRPRRRLPLRRRAPGGGPVAQPPPAPRGEGPLRRALLDAGEALLPRAARPVRLRLQDEDTEKLRVRACSRWRGRIGSASTRGRSTPSSPPRRAALRASR